MRCNGEQVLKPLYLIESGTDDYEDLADEMEMEDHNLTTPFARRERMIRFILEHYTFVSGARTTTREIKDAFFRFANHVPPFTEAQMNNYIGHAINVATTTTGQTLKDQGVQTKAKWDGAKMQQGYLNLGPLHGCAAGDTTAGAAAPP